MCLLLVTPSIVGLVSLAVWDIRGEYEVSLHQVAWVSFGSYVLARLRFFILCC